MNFLSQTFERALKCHQAGDLHQAETLYRQILQVDPRHVHALHLVGVVAHQVGKNDQAVDCIQRALRLHPDFPAAHNNLGLVLMAQGKVEEAQASYQQAVRLQPDFAEAYNNMANALKDQGKPEEAVGNYRQALSVKPDYAEAHNNLGNVLRDQGKLKDAIASYQEALRLKPDFAEAYNNMGNALRDQGKLEEAIHGYQHAVRLKPDYAEAYNNLGNVLRDRGKLDEAIAHCRQAVRLMPNYAEAHNNLANALRDQGKFDEAIASYQQALRLKPSHAEAHSNMGNALRDQGKLDEAIASYRQAVRLKPDYADAHNNLGNALRDQGKLEEAIASCQQGVRLKPDLAEAHNNLGNALWHLGRLDEALAAYRASVACKADNAGLHSNLVYSLIFHPDFDAAAILAECRRWNQQHAEPLATFIRPHPNRPDSNRRLRIGYVSPDFRDHAESFFTIPLLSNHDHSQVETYCYADDGRPDAVTMRMRGYADVWRSLVGMSDQQVAELIRSDQIDILVDLTMHMAKNRLLVFARKPAPIQVAWLAFPGTTGLATMDYRLTDPHLDPPGLFDACYTEKSIRLPDTWVCYDPLTDQALVQNPPALTNGLITFGCLNNFVKVNDEVLKLWATVLRAVPRSRLLLLAPRGRAREHVLDILRREEIHDPRVEFADRQPRQKYLQIYHRIDVGLDPLPYNGITTFLDAFWMGVPTFTLIGKTAAGRAGWSQLFNLGLPELSARTPEEYVALAVQLAGDLPRLQELRAGARVRMRASPLMDGQRFARHMEQAYRQMWHSWCRTRG